jgi:NADH-quinone oxidoreductase subunit D
MAITRINIGPVHPSTHGVLRLVVDLEGDTVKRVEPHIGFLHRGVEKLVENRMFMQSPPYMEKLDYITPLSYDEAYVAAVEAALGIEVKERAMYVRLIQLELQRLASHLFFLGTLCNDMGQLLTTFVWAFEDRDRILELLQEATGSRMFYVNMRLGGLSQDLPPDFEDKAVKFMEYFSKRITDYENYIEKNPLFKERMTGIGILSEEDAINFGVTGPVLRASGVSYDVRQDSPYYVYKRLHFKVKTETRGDNYARYRVRIEEMKESVRLIMLALKEMPEGDALGMPIRLILPAAKNRVSMVSRELPKGECMMYLVADAQKPYRLSIRSPSFINLAVYEHLTKDVRLVDLFPILGTLDLVMGCVDR